MIISPLLNLGTDPPTRPVLPPCGTIGIFFLKQNFTIFWIEVNDFGKKTADFYKLERLDPGYQVFFGENESICIGDSLEKIYDVFEKEEKDSSKKHKKFIKSANENYDIAIKDLVYRPGISPLELITPTTIKKIKYFLSNIKKDVCREFVSPKLRQILQFPDLFHGAKPSETPSFYNFMNYADFGLGTWHPEKGMYSIVEAMSSLALEM